MATDARQEPRITAYTFDRHGALLATEELTEEQAREETRRLADVEATGLPPFRFEQGRKGGGKGDIAQIDNRKISEPTFDSCR